MSRLIKIVTLAAVALLATAGVASAAVVANPDGTISVGKGDVQNALGLKNDAALQDYVKANDVTFTLDKSVTTWHFVNRCNGTNFVHEITSTTEQPVTVEEHRNAQDKISSGWTLTPAGAPTTKVKYSNMSAYNGYIMCKLFGGTDEGSNGSTVTTTSLPGLQVDGHELPITPAA